MLNFLEQYNRLPYEIRERVSSPEAMQAISELEEKYGVDLAIAVMRVMVKDVAIADLPKFLVFELEMDKERAQALADEMTAAVFSRARGFLGLGEERPEPGRSDAAAEPAAVSAAGPEMPANAPESANAPVEPKQSLAPAAPASPAAPRADFFFSPEDEEEVKELSRKKEIMKTAAVPTVDPDTVLSAVMKAVPVYLSSEMMLNRLQAVLRTYIRGIRNRIDTKQSLLKGADEGGVGLDLNTVEKLVFAADKEKEAAEKSEIMKPPPKLSVPEDALAKPEAAQNYRDKMASAQAAGLGRDAEYDFSRFKDKAAAPAPAPEKKEPAAAPETGKGSEISFGAEKPAKGVIDLSSQGAAAPAGPTEVQPAKPLKKEVAPVSVRRPAVQTEAPASGKIRMTDVKYVPKLTGPIDELREMDLLNFRRLSKDPLSAIAKIKEKVGILEAENYSERLAGIKAWRESPINQLYLAIGQESISQGRSVAEIISVRNSTGQETLTEPEFLSIMDLNKSLRF